MGRLAVRHRRRPAASPSAEDHVPSRSAGRPRPDRRDHHPFQPARAGPRRRVGARRTRLTERRPAPHRPGRDVDHRRRRRVPGARERDRAQRHRDLRAGPQRADPARTRPLPSARRPTGVAPSPRSNTSRRGWRIASASASGPFGSPRYSGPTCPRRSDGCCGCPSCRSHCSPTRRSP